MKNNKYFNLLQYNRSLVKTILESVLDIGITSLDENSNDKGYKTDFHLERYVVPDSVSLNGLVTATTDTCVSKLVGFFFWGGGGLQ